MSREVNTHRASAAASSSARRRSPRFSNALPQFLFYGGKGGVGKTTCAAARAVTEVVLGARVLVASTDPAHSLGDALAVRLSSSPRPVRLDRVRPSLSRSAERGSLHAIELDAHRAFARWLAQHRVPLGDVIEHGTWLDRGDVETLLDLPLPGIDELAGMLEIARLAGAAGSSDHSDLLRDADDRPRPAPAYDVIVVDTAPTGHTLRLLASPEAVAAVAAVLDDLQQEHRLIRERLSGTRRPEAADHLITLLADQAQRMASVMRDAGRAAFHWVTLPEALSLAETEDGIAAIEQKGIRIGEVIVNRVLPGREACPVCDARRKEERRVVTELARRAGRGRRIRLVPAQEHEPRGVPALAAIGRAMRSNSRFLSSPRFRLRATRSGETSTTKLEERSRAGDARRSGEGGGGNRTADRGRIVLSLSADQAVVSAESIGSLRDASLLFVAGKGGVGKTTVAAAIAIRLARVNSKQRVLLLSTDPAHSLGDVFGLPAGTVSDEPSAVRRGPANLFVRELDAVKALAVRRLALESAIDDIAASIGAAGRNRGVELMDLAPPGIDELFGILSVVEARDAYQLIVVDMAPTGHALRLLEQPDAARQWVQALLRVLLKYRSLARPGQLAQELVALSKSIRDLQTLLRDASQTHVVVVTRAADVPRLETDRLLADLRRLEMATPALVVNAMTLWPRRCRRCRAVAGVERTQLAALQHRWRSRSRRCAIIQTPLSAPPPRGVVALEEWAAQWRL